MKINFDKSLPVNYLNWNDAIQSGNGNVYELELKQIHSPNHSLTIPVLHPTQENHSTNPTKHDDYHIHVTPKSPKIFSNSCQKIIAKKISNCWGVALIQLIVMN